MSVRDLLGLLGLVETNPGPPKKLPPPSPKGLKVVSWNCNGLVAKWTVVSRHADFLSLDIIMIQETHLREGHDTPHLPGYRSYRRDRLTPVTDGTATRGGGIVTYVRDDLASEEVPHVLPAGDCVTERLDVRISCEKREPITLSNVYLTPVSASRGTRDPEYLRPGSLPMGKNTVIAGDFNAHHSSWDATVTTPNERGNVVRDWLDTHGYTVYNDRNEPTRDSSRHVLDLVVGRCAKLEPKTLGTWGSDHSPVSFHLPLEDVYRSERPFPTWNFKKARWDDYTAAVARLLAGVDTAAPIDSVTKGFTQALLTAANDHIPLCGMRRGPTPWWTAELEDAFEERNTLRELLLQEADVVVEEYRAKVKEVNRLLDETKREAWGRMAADLSRSKDLGAAFRAVKKLDGRHRKTHLPVLEGRFVSDKAKADRLGAHFAKLYGRRGDGNSKDAAPSASRLGCQAFTVDDLTRGLRRMKTRSAAGEDGIFSEMLLHLNSDSLGVLLLLLNRSWLMGVVPGAWKKGVIVPVPKPGKDATLLASYRPICLTSCLCKLLERMIEERLTFLLDADGTGVEGLHDSQAGFRRGRSTEEQVATLTECMSRNKDDRRLSAALLFDFSSAFDLVPHGALLDKMRGKGLPEPFVEWTRSFLCGRTAAVTIGRSRGSTTKVRRGVPQGSVLGPILYTIYVDELARRLEGLADVSVLYADDVAVVISSGQGDVAGLERKAQAVVDAVEDWCRERDMLLSTSKTQAVCVPPQKRLGVYFTSSRVPLQPGAFQNPLFGLGVNADGTISGDQELAGLQVVEAGGVRIRCVRDMHAAVRRPDVDYVAARPLPLSEHARYLGVTVDSGLTFGEHAQDILRRASKRLRVLKLLSGTSWGSKRDTLRSLYVTYILPLLRYCMGVYYSRLDDVGRKDLAGLHQEAAVLITGCWSGSGGYKLLAEAGLLPLERMAEGAAATMTAKAFCWQSSPVHRETVKLKQANRLGCGWLRSGYQALRRCGLEPKVHFEYLSATPLAAPWQTGMVDFRTDLPGGVTRSSPDADRRKAAEAALAALPPGIHAYTDGSVVQVGQKAKGGSGVYLQLPPPLTPVSVCHGVNDFCSSFRAEGMAVKTALDMVATLRKTHPSLAKSPLSICTDSLSLVEQLRAGPTRQREKLDHQTWSRLVSAARTQGTPVVLQFVPSHCGVDGNEKADALAGEGTKRKQDRPSLDYRSVRALVRRWVVRRSAELITSLAHNYAVATELRSAHFPLGFPRQAETVISRLRIGHSALFFGFLQTAGPNRKHKGVLRCPACHAAPMSREHVVGGCPVIGRGAIDTPAGTPSLAFSLSRRVTQIYDLIVESGLLAWSRSGLFTSPSSLASTDVTAPSNVPPPPPVSLDAGPAAPVLR
eukprot:TRINITY_DN2703_c0_g1_i6.p1 TRINITY_DN2703_c0_g1~~TRINITY_DN2703_c0_g1_i6.p1  ORF type:complete len:1384 (+),score=280.05 TRINITY_DN2703_c0_g1_i6:2835-6986(+)